MLINIVDVVDGALVNAIALTGRRVSVAVDKTFRDFARLGPLRPVRLGRVTGPGRETCLVRTKDLGEHRGRRVRRLRPRLEE